MKLEYIARASRECPLIRLYDFGPSEAKRLSELVKSLATGDREDVALHNEAWVESVGGCCLNLRRGDRDEGIRQSQALKFECVLTLGGWDNVEGLLEPFSEACATGFQWLTHDGRVALLISEDGRW
jgi:hypothetical protein